MERKWMVLINTGVAVTLSAVDGSSITIALPTIGRELADTSALDVVWMVIGYQLVTGAILVNIGRVADLYGRARLYKIGYVSLTVGSILCGLAQTGDQLVLFRFFQGGGAALIMANSTAIIMDAFPVKERGRAIGIWSMSLSSGMILGLVVGGALTTLVGWRWIFWINVPIGVFSIIFSHYTLHELRKLPGKPKMDWLGNVTFLVAITSCLVASTLFALALMDANTFYLLMAISLVSFAAFIFVERHTQAPMVSLSLFKIRAFAVGNTISFIQNIGRGTIQLILTFFLQGPTMLLTPLLASFYFIPSTIMTIVASPLSGYLSERYGYRIFTLLGTVLACVGSIMMAQFGPVVSFWQFSIPLIINGFGGGLFQVTNRTQVVGAVSVDDRGVATGVYMTFNNIGGLLSRGVTFLLMGLVLPGAIIQAIFSGALVSVENPTTFADQFVTSMHIIFYFSAILTGFAVILCLLWFMGIIKDSTEEFEQEVRAPAPVSRPDAPRGQTTDRDAADGAAAPPGGDTTVRSSEANGAVGGRPEERSDVKRPEG